VVSIERITVEPGRMNGNPADLSESVEEMWHKPKQGEVGTMHDRLLKILQRLDTDYEPFGKVEREGSDCSCGCLHFMKLDGEVGKDWGVCINPLSLRAGLLTFEHQGCSEFEAWWSVFDLYWLHWPMLSDTDRIEDVMWHGDWRSANALQDTMKSDG
jgi:hypothetical protein